MVFFRQRLNLVASPLASPLPASPRVGAAPRLTTTLPGSAFTHSNLSSFPGSSPPNGPVHASSTNALDVAPSDLNDPGSPSLGLVSPTYSPISFQHSLRASPSTSSGSEDTDLVAFLAVLGTIKKVCVGGRGRCVYRIERVRGLEVVMHDSTLSNYLNEYTSIFK